MNFSMPTYDLHDMLLYYSVETNVTFLMSCMYRHVMSYVRTPWLMTYMSWALHSVLHPTIVLLYSTKIVGAESECSGSWKARPSLKIIALMIFHHKNILKIWLLTLKQLGNKQSANQFVKANIYEFSVKSASLSPSKKSTALIEQQNFNNKTPRFALAPRCVRPKSINTMRTF